MLICRIRQPLRMGYWDKIQTTSTVYKAAFIIVKYMLVILNILQIAFNIWFLSYGISIINQQAEQETDAKKLQILDLNRTVVILSGVMTSIFCLVGLIGSIRESYACIVAYTTIVFVLLIASIFSPGKSKLLNILIIFSLTLVSAVFTSMLRLKEKSMENVTLNPVEDPNATSQGNRLNSTAKSIA